jgi:hypothetical protein
MPCLLLSTIFQNFHALSEVMSGEPLIISTYDGPLWQKITKDCIYALIAVGVVMHARARRTNPFTGHSAIVFTVIVALCLLSAISNSFLVALVGLRWIVPLLLFMIMKVWIRRLDTRTTTLWFYLGLGTCFVSQVYQLLYMPPVFGEVLPGLPARTPGIFIAPNSTAFFACTSAACVLTFRGNTPRMTITALLIATCICALTQSGTGILTIALLLLNLALRRHPTLFWTSSALAILFIFPNLDQITMRDDFLFLSGGSRLERLLEITKASWLSFSSFGLYTNASNLLSEAPAASIAVDSLLAAWIGNIGLLSLPLALFLGLFAHRSMRDISLSRATPCIIVFAAFSVTTIIFEAFPMNLHLAIGFWLALKDAPPPPTPITLA